MNRHISSLLNFLDNSPCNFLAVATAKELLTGNGFTELKLGDKWQLRTGGKYFTTKNDSAIFAFTLGETSIADAGVKIIAAHRDYLPTRVHTHPYHHRALERAVRIAPMLKRVTGRQSRHARRA